MNLMLKSHTTKLGLSAEFQFQYQIWGSNFNWLDSNSYPTLDTSVKYTLYTLKFILAKN